MTHPMPAGLDWQALPKIELHRHFEGSIPLNFVRRLADEDRIPFTTDWDELKARLTFEQHDPRTPESFLAPFKEIRKLFQDEEILWQAGREVILAAADENIRYLELHITPRALASSSSASPAQAARWVCQSALEAASEREITVKFIVSLNRHENLELAEEAVAAAMELRSLGVVAVDLAGDEANYGAEPFAPLMQMAKSEGLRVSVHAGEWAGPESVAYAMDQLGADRIVHGVRIMEQQELVRRAREQRLPFAVCLTSNLQSGVVNNLHEHPLPLMIAAGLQVSLATDDPAISGTTLSTEFNLATEHLALSDDSLRGLILAGTQAAFLNSRDRERLERNFQRRLGLALDSPDF